METWVREKSSFADGIGYRGGDESLLIEASSGGLAEDLTHTLGDSLKLLQNLIGIINTNRARFQNATSQTFGRFKAIGIQSIKTTITLISVSQSSNGQFVYQQHRSSEVPVSFDQRYRTLPLFELLACLLVLRYSLLMHPGID